MAVNGGLAQLARAPVLQAGGQRFESVILHPSRRPQGRDEKRTLTRLEASASGLGRERSERKRVETQKSFTTSNHKAKKCRISDSDRRAAGSGRTERKIKTEQKGRMGDAWALGGDEGRDKLRKAAARGKYPLTRGCPNGATRRKRFRHQLKAEANAGN